MARSADAAPQPERQVLVQARALAPQVRSLVTAPQPEVPDDLDLRGHLDVIQVRARLLKTALDQQPGRTYETEWAFDRLQRAIDKLARFVGEGA